MASGALNVWAGFDSLHQCQAKWSNLKAEMKMAIVSLNTRVDGVILGLPLAYLFWGSLLLQYADVTQKDNLWQTRLAIWCRGAKPTTYARTKSNLGGKRRKLQDSKPFCGEDFCGRVREFRRKLTTQLKAKAKRSKGCRVSMVFA